MTVRTRFAPSPTGFLHIGGARTALFSRAYARRHGGTFVLRIEDTDTERSTQASVQAILDSLQWLGLDWDEGPLFQMQRLARYQEVAEQLIAAGHAYRDYMPKQALDALRAEQSARGEKPRYDRAVGQKYRGDGPAPVRFRTPQEGTVGWKDLVKGPIEFPNAELDDLVLLRADGVPTYNFGVVVDDLDMRITHVIRGDDHVNNTPRQMHIFRALGGSIPEFAHVPMILGADGERLSKRHGAVSVTQYRDEGFLPEALDNYLARLGWSHGDDEVFSMEQFERWFDFEHVSHSPARFDSEKLKWLNQQYLKQVPSKLKAQIARRISPELVNRTKDGPPLEPLIEFYSQRNSTVGAASSAALEFLKTIEPPRADLDRLLTAEVRPAILEARLQFERLIDWNKAAIGDTIKTILKAHGLKMPQIANALRLVVWGELKQVPIDDGLAMLGRKHVLARLDQVLHQW